MKDKQPTNISRRDFMIMGGLSLGAMAFGPHLEFPGFEGPEVKHNWLDVLDFQTQLALAKRASAFIRPTHDGANVLADTLRNTRQSDANNICGPLAFAQLTGITAYGVRPQDLWLLNPAEYDGQRILREAFPEDRFDKFDVSTPLGDYDFNSWVGRGVQPGDFFFFRAKDHGSPHMVAISRRGYDGKIYCITNYPDESGNFITKEVVFWDPANTEKSWVKELAKGANAAKFSSGNAGFYQYRLKDFQPSTFDKTEQSPDAEALRQKINDLSKTATGEWHVMIKNLATGRTVAEVGSRLEQHAASQFKVALAMVFMSYLEGKSKDETELKGYLVPVSPLVAAMLVNSDEDATNKLTDILINSHIDRQRILDSWKAGDTDLSQRHVTADALVNLLARIYDPKSGTFKFGFTRNYLLELLSTQTDNDKTRLGLIPGFGVTTGKIYDKRGSINQKGGDIIVGDSGIVEVVNPRTRIVTPYVLSFTGHAIPPEWKATYNSLGDEIDALIQAFAEYAKKVNG